VKLFILILLGGLLVYSLILLIKEKKRENYLFLSYLLLVFVVIYSVSVLGYKIGGSNFSVEQITKEVSEDVMKMVLLEIADNYVYIATERGRWDSYGNLWYSKEMIRKRDKAENLYKKADVPQEEILKKLNKINVEIAQDILIAIRSKALNVMRTGDFESLEKSKEELIASFEEMILELEEKKELKENYYQKVQSILSKYNVTNQEVESYQKALVQFLESKVLP